MAGFTGLVGSTVLVTGAASGIGRAVALRLGEEGAIVGVLDRAADGAVETAEAIRAAGGDAHAYGVDITESAQVEDAVGGLVERTGGVAGLVNNAGVDVAKPFLETDPALWRQLVEVNLMGPLNVTHAVLAHMVEAGYGRIVSMASDAGRVGSSGEAVYAACKGGIVSFSKSVAREVARKGVTLNIVSPGPTDTPLFANFDETGRLGPALERAIPMRRLGQPGDYPGLVAFLLSAEAGYITGQTISVSGGLSMHG